MKTLTVVIAMTITALGATSTSVAEAPVPLQEPVTVTALEIIEVKEVTFKDRLLQATIDERRTMVREKVMALAKEYGVSGEQVYRTAYCENNTFDPNRQSEHRYTFSNPKWGTVAGERERSFGLPQIHLPSHPNITHEQATDPEWSLEWMVKEFANGRASAWTCWKQLYGVQ